MGYIKEVLKIKRFRISVIIEAENMVSADAKFKEITGNGIEVKQITRLPTVESRMRIKKKIENVLGKLDTDILETLYNDEDYALL